MKHYDNLARRFRGATKDGTRSFGTFVKMAVPQPIEILALNGFDFIVIDQEHAPFDRASSDIAILAAFASGIPCLVRVPNAAPESLLSVLDSGASGVVVPHVGSSADAERIVASCRYRNGGRGYSGSPRAAAYGCRTMHDHIERSDSATTIVAQIEDGSGLDNAAAIADVEGIDALFVGRADLAVALGADGSDASVVMQAFERIVRAAQAASKPVWAFAANAREAKALLELGASSFIVSSDQGMIKQAASLIMEALQPLGRPESRFGN